MVSSDGVFVVVSFLGLFLSYLDQFGWLSWGDIDQIFIFGQQSNWLQSSHLISKKWARGFWQAKNIAPFTFPVWILSLSLKWASDGPTTTTIVSKIQKRWTYNWSQKVSPIHYADLYSLISLSWSLKVEEDEGSLGPNGKVLYLPVTTPPKKYTAHAVCLTTYWVETVVHLLLLKSSRLNKRCYYLISTPSCQKVLD